MKEGARENKEGERKGLYLSKVWLYLLYLFIPQKKKSDTAKRIAKSERKREKNPLFSFSFYSILLEQLFI
jgi:hypothetical protein